MGSGNLRQAFVSIRSTTRLGVSSFALALLLAGAEPEELATAVTASIRKLPAIALGDVIGANITICLVALGVGALVAPLPFGRKVLRYAVFGLPLGAVGAWFAWDGHLSRTQGAVLVLLYLAYVAVVWVSEGKPPSLGEAQEVEEANANAVSQVSVHTGWDILLVLAGVAAMAIGSLVLVEAVRRVAPMEARQARLGLTLVGFATGFELVVLAFSAARHGASEAAIAAVVGSFAYNATMTLGAAALVRPLALHDSKLLHVPLVLMIGALALVIALAIRKGRLGRLAGVSLIMAYAFFVACVLFCAPR